jgi:hypothetical protein
MVAAEVGHHPQLAQQARVEACVRQRTHARARTYVYIHVRETRREC